MSDETVEARRAARLQQLAEREAEDRARAAEDAALDLPLLAEIETIAGGELEPLIARLDALAANLVRKGTAHGLTLPFQLEQLGLVRKNIQAVTKALAEEGRALILSAEA